MKRYQVLATIHWLVLLAVAISDVYILIYEPLYMSIVVLGVCFRFIFSSESCPLTEWEDRARIKAGVETTNGKFIKFYIQKVKDILCI